MVLKCEMSWKFQLELGRIMQLSFSFSSSSSKSFDIWLRTALGKLREKESSECPENEKFSCNIIQTSCQEGDYVDGLCEDGRFTMLYNLLYNQELDHDFEWTSPPCSLSRVHCNVGTTSFLSSSSCVWHQVQTLQLKLNFSLCLCVHRINQKHWYIRHRLTLHINHQFLHLPLNCVHLHSPHTYASQLHLTLEHFIAGNYWTFQREQVRLKFDEKKI